VWGGGGKERERDVKKWKEKKEKKKVFIVSIIFSCRQYLFKILHVEFLDQVY